jgi:chromate transporter
MVLWELFRTFLMLGMISFGGGYAMIPIVEAEVSRYGWMTTEQLTNIIAIAGMSPGPIGSNLAVLIGYSTAGLSGALIATLGILLPSLVLVIIVAAFFMKLHENEIVKSIFYGLKPIVTSLIIYAAIRFAMSNNLISIQLSFETISLFMIFGLSLYVLLKHRWNPVFVILVSGLVGIALYS